MTRASTSAATVVVLCAAWCGTCREFRLVFDRLRASRPEARFFWLDVEDGRKVIPEVFTWGNIYKSLYAA